IIEPKFIRLLQLIYWIYINCNLGNNNSFQKKLNQVCEELKVTDNEEDLLINKILKDDFNVFTYPELIKQIQSSFSGLYSKISSYLPEFMIAGLLKMEKYNVNFIQESNLEKRCDLHINDINIEIKTIHD